MTERRGPRCEVRGPENRAYRSDPQPPTSHLDTHGPELEPRTSVLGNRVALVHDWLTGMRGGEKVLEAIAELYPDAPIYTLLHVKGSVSRALESRRIFCSFVQWLPGSARHYRGYLPLFPTAIEQFDFDRYDLVISTSHCAAKSVVVPGRTAHLCYCHSPMRYAWDQFPAYFGPEQVGAVRSRLLRPVLARLARWDAATASRVDRFVANSQYVAGRIARYYNRKSAIVYPSVDTEFYQPDPTRRPEPFFLVVSALVPYKRLEVAIRACEAVGVLLRIVGRGPEEGRLRQLGSGRVEFLGWRTDEEIRTLYQHCRAVLMPGVEDFGMVPVEAQACGRPVVAYAQGGALESVIDGTTGVLVNDPSVDAFAAALRDVSSRDFDPADIRRHAESFSRVRFQREFQEQIANLLCEASQ
jgi:glycosyltransferase involved in cell wall biosynthesis